MNGTDSSIHVATLRWCSDNSFLKALSQRLLSVFDSCVDIFISPMGIFINGGFWESFLIGVRKKSWHKKDEWKSILYMIKTKSPKSSAVYNLSHMLFGISFLWFMRMWCFWISPRLSPPLGRFIAYTPANNCFM